MQRYQNSYHHICTTDPMSLKDLADTTGLPYVVEGDADHNLVIYFESETNRQAYLDIPVEHPISELSINLDNPTAACIDEG
jgi:hypothetical protein